MKTFPARLPQQPIFYPVLQLEYARQIASDWNVKREQFAGYVTEFKVEDDYINHFEEHAVGGLQYQELWIPAEEMEEFNRHITGHIKVVEAYFAEGFQGFIPEQFGLHGKDAIAQFTMLANSYIYSRMDFYLEIKRNHKAVYLNYPFWQKYDSKNPGLKEKMLQSIREVWLTSFPKTPLPVLVHEDVPSGKDVDTDAFEVQADDEPQPSPLKQTHSTHLVKPLNNNIPPAKRNDVDSFGHTVERKNQPAKKPVSPSEEKKLPPPQEPSSSKKTDAPASDKRVYKNFRSVEQKGLHFVGNRTQEDMPVVQQPGSHFIKGVELGLSGKYREAIDELSKVLEKDPNDVAAQTSLGIAFHRLGEDERALACYEAALKVDSRYAEAYYFQANILYRQGNIPGAIAGYTIAIGLKPELIDAHQDPLPQDRLTDFSGTPAELYRIARPAHRILDLNRSLEASPRQASLFKERAAEYSRLWNYEQAIADYSSSLAIHPEDASALHLRGVAFEQIGNRDRALEDYKQAVSIDPQLSNEFIERGVTYGKTGNFRQSIASLTDGIRLAPGNANGYFNRGTTYFQLGDFENAIQDFSMVIKLSSNDDAAYYWRGISHEEAGRQPEAVADYRQFLRLSHDPDARQQIEQKLRSWNAGDQENAGDSKAAPKTGQKTNPPSAEEPDQGFDLYDLIVALDERALNSTWFGSDVECYGAKAEELFAFTDHNKPIEGHDLLHIASGIRHTVEGDFQAFDPGAKSYWMFIRAWKGSGFYVETDDPKAIQRLRSDFKSVEDVEDVPQPYKGFFIHV
ncbi:MAG: tetratricopeptide repeat protein [Bacteroidota bacterium]